MHHAHVRVRYACLLHRLLFECLHKVFEPLGSFCLVMHLLLLLQSQDHTSDIILISVLVRIQIDIAHNVVLCDAEVFILPV